MQAVAEIAIAKATAADIERRLAAGGIMVKRRRASHTIVRACRFYAAALEFEVERGAAPAIEVASGKGCSPSVLSTDQRHEEASLIHAPINDGTWIPDAEETAQLSEEGLRGDGSRHR